MHSAPLSPFLFAPGMTMAEPAKPSPPSKRPDQARQDDTGRPPAAPPAPPGKNPAEATGRKRRH